MNTEEFIKKAELKFPNKFDYSRVDYKGSRIEVELKCIEHGLFKRRPGSFLAKNSAGCYECGNIIKAKTKEIPKEEFIRRCNEVHNYKYSYEKTNYDIMHNEIIITCPVDGHGDFSQLPINHIKGHGCPICSKVKRYTPGEFLEKANAKFYNKFKYALREFANSETPITIICPVHYEFKQTPAGHLKSIYGCEGCCYDSKKGRKTGHTPTNKKTTEQFRQEMKLKNIEVLGEYVTNDTPIKVKCEKGHEWTTRPKTLIQSNCPQCAREAQCYRDTLVGINEAKYFQPFIDKICKESQLEYEFQQEFSGWFVDVFVKDLNLVIEYDEEGHRYKKEYDEKRQNTIEKRFGVTFIRINEKEFLTNESQIYNGLKEEFSIRRKCNIS